MADTTLTTNETGLDLSGLGQFTCGEFEAMRQLLDVIGPLSDEQAAALRNAMPRMNEAARQSRAERFNTVLGAMAGDDDAEALRMSAMEEFNGVYADWLEAQAATIRPPMPGKDHSDDVHDRRRDQFSALADARARSRYQIVYKLDAMLAELDAASGIGGPDEQVLRMLESVRRDLHQGDLQ